MHPEDPIMARTRLGLWAEGAIVTVVLAAFLLNAFPLVAKGESIPEEMGISDCSL
jgi:hypothetical protein